MTDPRSFAVTLAGRAWRPAPRSLGRDLAEGGIDRDALTAPVPAGREEDPDRDDELERRGDQLVLRVEEERVGREHEVQPHREVEEPREPAQGHHRDPADP